MKERAWNVTVDVTLFGGGKQWQIEAGRGGLTDGQPWTLGDRGWPCWANWRAALNFRWSRLAVRVSQISTDVKKFTRSRLMWFYEILRVQWNLFSRTDLLYAVRISNQGVKFLWGPKIKFSVQFHFVVKFSSWWQDSKPGLKVQIS